MDVKNVFMNSEKFKNNSKVDITKVKPKNSVKFKLDQHFRVIQFILKKLKVFVQLNSRKLQGIRKVLKF